MGTNPPMKEALGKISNLVEGDLRRDGLLIILI